MEEEKVIACLEGLEHYDRVLEEVIKENNKNKEILIKKIKELLN